MILWGYLSSIGYGVACLVLSLVLYKLGIAQKYTRKVVHILVGFEWVFLYHFFGSGIHFLIVCLAFLALLVLVYKKSLMPMISSEGDNAPGTVYYAVAMSAVALVGCFVPEIMLPFGIGIFCTSVGDGFAGLIGQLVTKHNPKIYGNKTLFGTLANFVFSFLSATVMSLVFDMGLTVWQSLAIALLSASLELIVVKGLDNIAITWAVTALAYAFMYNPEINQYIIPILCTPPIIMFAISKKALTPAGVVTAIGVDAVISATLGNFGFILLMTFFCVAVLIDKIKKRIDPNGNGEELKGDCRDHMQVIVNALIPSLAAVLFWFSRDYVYIVAFVASLSEALADSAASGVGSFARRTYDPFRLKVTKKGLSGGMSVIGTLASLCGAALVSAVALAFGAVGIKAMLIAVLAAFCGAIFDSFLGSVFQVKYKCTVCSELTEKHKHCGVSTVRSRGLTLIDNDVVNLLSSLFAAGLAITLTSVIL